ncbi:hypothetical protein LTR92_000801 [Exophiala xenobiotica]|nr:hypothetical protein LTR92_000801 [Exophiala xenobiotica]
MPIPTPVKSYGLARPGVSLPRRHRLKARNADAIQGVTRPAIRRLARRGGVLRIQKEIYDETRKVLRDRLAEILRRVVALLGGTDRDRARPSVPDPGRKTVTTQDVVYVLNRMGQPIYGFESPYTGERRRGAILPWRT